MMWILPPPTLRILDELPAHRPVAMMVRHSVRGDLPPGPEGAVVPLTDDGHRLAGDLGARLGARLRSVHTSPLLRTIQTAEALLRGAGFSAEARPDTMLGDPGAFVVDHRAGPTWQKHGHEEVMRRLVAGTESLPGLADADAAARALVQHMLHTISGQASGVHAFVTHDSLIAATVARISGVPQLASDWPWFLEAAFFWEQEGQVHTRYRDLHTTRTAPLVGLTTADVAWFARREVAATVGLDCPARFFLAGGAFKSLLTGRSPRDLDLWPASAADREALLRRLHERRATQLPPQPYRDVFHLQGRTVEVPHHTTPGTLEARLARFDLGLSAIGAEYAPDDEWRVVIHPKALESLSRRQILLLDDLPAGLHALTSLDRMRRYARELGFASPPEEEQRLWAIYDAQSPERRRELVDRLRLSCPTDDSVLCDLARRA